MTRFLLSRCLGVLLTVWALTFPSQAQTPTPTPTPSALSGIFNDKGALGLASVESAANAQKTSTPYYKSNGVETRYYEGYFKAAANTSKLALLSDDGTSVWIDGQAVLSRAGQGQGFDQPGATTFYPLSKSFTAGQTYYIKLQYTNTYHTGDADIDGVSLWAYDGGGAIVSPSIDVDMDVDNTTVSGYPTTSNGDRSLAEEDSEKTMPVRIFTNIMDIDDDGVPGYADGIDKFGNGQANSCWKFEPMVVEIPQASTFSNGEITISYSASDPSAMTLDSDGMYIPAAGVLRIWKKDGDQVRSPLSAHQSGDFLRAGQSYSPSQLGFGAGSIVTLYVEAVDWYGFENTTPITVNFYPSGLSKPALVFSQTIKVRPYYISSENPSSSTDQITNPEQ